MSDPTAERPSSPDDDFLMMKRGSGSGMSIPEGLNLTAMMDLLTIILVYLVKVYADMPAAASQVQDLTPGETVLSRETMQSGTLVLLTRTAITQGSTPIEGCRAETRAGPPDKNGRPTTEIVRPMDTTPESPCWTALRNSLSEVVKTNEETEKLAKDKGMVLSLEKNLLLVVDAQTSYDEASNVLLAAGQARFTSFQLITKQSQKLGDK
jgi:biopolymer transport protein ExbD